MKKSLLRAILILWGVVTVVFYLFNILPADPARMTLGQRSDIATEQQIRKDLNLDLPTWQRYLMYLNDLSPIGIKTGDRIGKDWSGWAIPLSNQTAIYLKWPQLGRSYQTKQKVSTVLMESLPGTAILALAAIIIATFLGLILGILAAVYRDTWIDQLAILLSTMGISVPSFFAGIIIAWLFGYVLHDITGLSLIGSLYEMDAFQEKHLVLKNLILPAIALGIRPMAIITQLMRNSMLEVLSMDYIRTAYAKGLSKKQVIYRHAIRNAINPVITAIGGWFGELLAGSFFVEYIFAWKGIGKVTVDALNRFDFPIVMGSVLLSSLIFISISFLTDYLYTRIDPRVKFED